MAHSETHDLPFTLVAVPEDPEYADPAASALKALPALPRRFQLDTGYRSLQVFEIQCSDDHCIKIMRDYHHPNILRLESIIYSAEENSQHLLYVQPFDGNLESYFDQCLSLETVAIRQIIPAVQEVFRQAINGMAYLMEHGLHHCGFSLLNTYYCMKTGAPVVKLSNFQSIRFPEGWDYTMSDIFSEDWISIGLAVDKFCELAIEHKGPAINPLIAELRELGRVLKNKEIGALEMKDTALKQVFFWSPEKRASVFTYNVPALLKKNDPLFIANAIKFFTPPAGFHWGENEFDGLVKAMNDYRMANFKSKYVGTKPIHYMKFVCGSYTHEDEFKHLTLTVDAIFRRKDPFICLNLVKALKGTEKDREKGQQ